MPDVAGEIGQILRSEGDLGAGGWVDLKQVFGRLGNNVIAARPVVKNAATVV